MLLRLAMLLLRSSAVAELKQSCKKHNNGSARGLLRSGGKGNEVIRIDFDCFEALY